MRRNKLNRQAGKKMSKATRAKMSLAMYARWADPKLRPKTLTHGHKPVACYNIKTRKLVKWYSCIGDVRKDGLTRRSVQWCLDGTFKTYKGLHWRLAESTIVLQPKRLTKDRLNGRERSEQGMS